MCYLDWISVILSTAIYNFMVESCINLISFAYYMLIGRCDSFRLVSFNYKYKFLWVRSLHLPGTVTADSVQSGGDIRPVSVIIACPCINKPLHSYASFGMRTYATTTHRSPCCNDIFIWLRAQPSLRKTSPAGFVVVSPFVYLDLHRHVSGTNFRSRTCFPE